MLLGCGKLKKGHSPVYLDTGLLMNCKKQQGISVQPMLFIPVNILSFDADPLSLMSARQ